MKNKYTYTIVMCLLLLLTNRSVQAGNGTIREQTTYELKGVLAARPSKIAFYP